MKEKLKKGTLGFITFMLVIYLCTSIVFLTLLNIGKNYINKEKVENVVNSIDIASIIKDNVEIENIKKELLDTGLSNQAVEQFINSKEVEKFENEVVTNVVYDILNKGNIEYKIDVNKMNELVYSNISELKQTDKYNELQNSIHQKVEQKIPLLVDNANGLLDKISNKIQESPTFLKYKNYINKAAKIFDIIYSTLVNVAIIFIILSFIVILIYTRKKIYMSLKWIGISLLSSSLILKLFSMLIGKILKETKFNKLMDVIIKDFSTYYLIYVIIGIIFIIINIAIYYKIRKKKKLTNLDIEKTLQK